MIRPVLILVLYLISYSCEAQTYLPFEQVRKYTKQQNPNKYDSAFKLIRNRLGAELHYLYPLYQAITWEDKFRKLMGEKSYNSTFAEMLAFAGDYSMAIKYDLKSQDSLSDKAIHAINDTVNKLKNIQYAPAKSSVIGNASFYSVIMINESHAKPVHRAFTYSLLKIFINRVTGTLLWKLSIITVINTLIH